MQCGSGRAFAATVAVVVVFSTLLACGSAQPPKPNYDLTGAVAWCEKALFNFAVTLSGWCCWSVRWFQGWVGPRTPCGWCANVLRCVPFWPVHVGCLSWWCCGAGVWVKHDRAVLEIFHINVTCANDCCGAKSGPTCLPSYEGWCVPWP